MIHFINFICFKNKLWLTTIIINFKFLSSIIELKLSPLAEQLVEQVLAAISAQLPARTNLAGCKRPLPVEDQADYDEYDTLSVHANACGPLGLRDHSESDVCSLTGNLPEKVSSMARGIKQSAS